MFAFFTHTIVVSQYLNCISCTFRSTCIHICLCHAQTYTNTSEHFKNAVVCSNVLYCIGASAMESFEKKIRPPPRVREDGHHGTSGIHVNTIELVPLEDKPVNPVRLRQLVIEQKERITAIVEVYTFTYLHIILFMYLCTNNHIYLSIYCSKQRRQKNSAHSHVYTSANLAK